MSEHPQTAAYRNAAATMKAERYWDHEDLPEGRTEFLKALGDVLTEVCYQLAKYQVLDPEAMEAYRAAAPASHPQMIPTSAELLLTTALERRINTLAAVDAHPAGQVDAWVLDTARKAVAKPSNKGALVFPPRRGKTVDPKIAEQWPQAMQIARDEAGRSHDKGASE